MESKVIRKRIVVVGDGACGKTSLIATYYNNKFPENHVPTIYEETVKDIILDGMKIQLLLNDTAGEEDYDRLRPLSYTNVNVAIICFAINNPTSKENVRKKWSKEIKHFLPHVPIVLVGTKSDLRTNPKVISDLKQINQQPISYKEGDKLGKSIKAEFYRECSALTLVGIKQLFEDTVRLSFVETKKRVCSIM